MTFPETYNLSGPKKEGIISNSSKEAHNNLGITNLKTPLGNTVKEYSAERSICDVLKKGII